MFGFTADSSSIEATSVTHWAAITVFTVFITFFIVFITVFTVFTVFITVFTVFTVFIMFSIMFNSILNLRKIVVGVQKEDEKKKDEKN